MAADDIPDPVLDPPPATTHDVATPHDPPPADPVDVPVGPPDPPPAIPFDVPVLTDQGPGGPFDVSVVVDPPPADPVNVEAISSPDPAGPTDAMVFLDPGPSAPFDVETPPDLQPSDPHDVPVSVDPPPSVPYDVPTPVDPGPTVPYVPVYPPDPPPADVTIEGHIASLSILDSRVADLLRSVTDFEPSAFGAPGALALDPLALARWWKDYITERPSSFAQFIVEQQILYSQNIVHRVFNPGYAALMSLPVPPGTLQTSLDDVSMGDLADVRENILTLEVSSHDTPGSEQNSYSQNASARDLVDFDVGDMVDAAMDGRPHPYTGDGGRAGNTSVSRFIPTKMFSVRQSDGSSRWQQDVRGKLNAVVPSAGGLARAAATDGIVPVSFPGEVDGCILTATPESRVALDDDDAYLPLAFTDLRRTPEGQFRTVYFRALDLKVAESTSPEWEDQSAFGRTDPVMTYVRTTRAYSISFNVQVFAPEELALIHRKLHWLKSMCYPSYTSQALYRSGPVLRLRVGDLVAAGGMGLPGVIRSLSEDFGDALWELRRGFKVPRSCGVTVDFAVLHDGPVGLLDGQFGVLDLPRLGEVGPTDPSDVGRTSPTQDETGRSLRRRSFGFQEDE